MICDCRQPLPCPESGSCVLCGKSIRPQPAERPTHVTIPVDEWDCLLQYRRRVGYVAERQ